MKNHRSIATKITTFHCLDSFARSLSWSFSS